MLFEPGPARPDDEPISPDMVVIDELELCARSPNKPLRGLAIGVPGAVLGDDGGDGFGVLIGLLGVLGVLGLLS